MSCCHHLYRLCVPLPLPNPVLSPPGEFTAVRCTQATQAGLRTSSAKECGKAGVMFLWGSSPCSPLPGRAQFQSAEGRREALMRAWPALRTRVCQAPEGGMPPPFPFLSYLGPQEPGVFLGVSEPLLCTQPGPSIGRGPVEGGS